MVEQEIINVDKVVEKPAPTPPKKKKSTWKYLLNIAIVLIVSGVAIFLALKDNFDLIVSYIVGSNYLFLLAILGIMVLLVLVRALILFVFARLFTRDYYYHQAVAVHFVGVFYSAVTPGGQGGEVMQAYTYKKQGIHISCAVSALAMHSILYQIVLILYGIASLIIKYDYIQQLPFASLGKIGDVNIEIPIWVLTLLGFGLNVGYIGIILGMSYWKGLHHFVMGPIIELLHKIHIIKDADKSRESLRNQLENFKIETRRLFSNVPFTILVSVLFFIFLSLTFSVPFFVGLAMHNESTCASIWDSIFLGNFHQMATGLIPIPGSAGVSEFVFRSLFCALPATPSSSFYFISAGDVVYSNSFNELLTDTSKFEWFFNSIKSHISGLENETLISFYDGQVKALQGQSFADLANDNLVRQFIIAYSDYRESSSLASAAMVMWRSVTFIIPLAVAGFVTAFYRASPKNENVDSENLPNRRTLVALRNETYVERVQMAETMIETSKLTRESIRQRLKFLANRDRRRARERRRKEIEEENNNMNNDYRNVNINKNDDEDE